MKDFQEKILIHLDFLDVLFKKENSNNDFPSPKIASFDLDKTLIDGDFADTVYTYMISKGYKFKMDYQTFLKEISINPRHLFLDFPTFFRNLKRDEVKKYIREVIKLDKFTFEENETTFEAKVPKPKEEFLWLIEELKMRNYIISVISASPEDIVKEVSKTYYNLEGEVVFGIKSKFSIMNNEEVYTDEIHLPTSVIEGKAIVYNTLFEHKPLITAGDSINDLYLLNLTKNDGITILCNKIHDKIDYIKSHLKTNTKIITINY